MENEPEQIGTFWAIRNQSDFYYSGDDEEYADVWRITDWTPTMDYASRYEKREEAEARARDLLANPEKMIIPGLVDTVRNPALHVVRIQAIFEEVEVCRSAWKKKVAARYFIPRGQERKS